MSLQINRLLSPSDYFAPSKKLRELSNRANVNLLNLKVFKEKWMVHDTNCVCVSLYCVVLGSSSYEATFFFLAKDLKWQPRKFKDYAGQRKIYFRNKTVLQTKGKKKCTGKCQFKRERANTCSLQRLPWKHSDFTLFFLPDHCGLTFLLESCICTQFWSISVFFCFKRVIF